MRGIYLEPGERTARLGDISITEACIKFKVGSASEFVFKAWCDASFGSHTHEAKRVFNMTVLMVRLYVGVVQCRKGLAIVRLRPSLKRCMIV